MYLLWNLQKNYFKIDNDNNLRVGTDDNDCWILEDKDNNWKKLIQNMNGNLKVDQLLSLYPQEYKSVIKKGIQLLIEKGLVLKLDKPFFKSEWNQKNASNIFYFHDEKTDGIKFQKKINKLKVTIFGLGGGGFTLFEHLISVGVQQFNLVDFDKIESSNLNRQNSWKESDIGKYKVDVAFEYAKNRNSNIKITRSYEKVIKYNDVYENITMSDWVFSCMDEPPYFLQRLVNKACFDLNKPILFCFCQKNNGRYFFIKTNKGGCVDCLFSNIIDNKLLNFIKDLTKSKFKPVTTATSYTIQMLVSSIMIDWIKILKNDESIFSSIKRIDFLNLSLENIIKWKKNENCITCGTGKIENEEFKKFLEFIKI